MTRAQALTQQLGALLDLRSCIHAGHIHCCAGMVREIEAKAEQIRREIRTLEAAASRGVDTRQGMPRRDGAGLV